MRVARERPHGGDGEGEQHQQNIDVGIAQDLLEGPRAVVVGPVGACPQTGPLGGIGPTDHRLLREFGGDFKGLPGQQPATAQTLMHPLGQEAEAGPLEVEFPLEAEANCGIGEASPEAPRDEAVDPRHFPQLFPRRAAGVQHVQQVQVPRPGGGVVVIDPPRTATDGATAVDLQWLQPQVISREAKPSAGAVVKSLAIDAGGRHDFVWFQGIRQIEISAPLQCVAEGQGKLPVVQPPGNSRFAPQRRSEPGSSWPSRRDGCGVLEGSVRPGGCVRGD